MIIVLGSINMDLFFNPARSPEAGETVLLKNCEMLPGGKGANQAVAAARMGASVMMAGCVGEDGFGEAALAYIHDQNIDISLVKIGQDATGLATITVDASGENRQSMPDAVFSKRA